MIAKTEMLIRRPVAEVLEVFIKPHYTTKLWFTESSRRLESGKGMRWDWEIYNSGTDVDVKAIGSTEGFTLVLARSKAPLEQRINLNLISNCFPSE